MSKFETVVSLNVGGHIYTTARSTLTRYRDSMLGAMFGGDFDALRDDQGRYFIDRNGRLFEHVLNFLRTTQLVLPEDFKELHLLEMEADFYQIQPLIEALKDYKARLETGRCDVVFLSRCTAYVNGQPKDSLRVDGSSSANVERMVRLLIEHENGRHSDWNVIPALLGRLQDKGFTVPSYIGDTLKWVLVRKKFRESSDNK